MKFVKLRFVFLILWLIVAMLCHGGAALAYRLTYFDGFHRLERWLNRMLVEIIFGINHLKERGGL